MKTKPAEPPTGGTHLAQASLPDTIQKINGALRALLCLAIGLLARLGRCPGQGFEFVNDSGCTATVWYYYHVISCGAGGYGWYPQYGPCITSVAPYSSAGMCVPVTCIGGEEVDGVMIVSGPSPITIPFPAPGVGIGVNVDCSGFNGADGAPPGDSGDGGGGAGAGPGSGDGAPPCPPGECCGGGSGDGGGDGDGSPDPGEGDGAPGCSSCQGMPVWRVSQPYINLWIHDEPLGYQPARGPRISLNLAFAQRGYSAGRSPSMFSVGKNWNFSWLSYVRHDWNTNNVVHFSDGRERTFTSTNDYLTNTRLTGDATNGFTLSYPNGAQDVYGFVVTNSSGFFVKAFLSERRNRSSQRTRFNYGGYDPANPVIRLQSLVDADGLTNTISYVSANTYSTNLISQVTDPFGRTVAMLYHTNGCLTNITDVAGLSSSFLYETNEWVTNMITPYGTNSFAITDAAQGAAPNGRSILVAEPDGSHQLFLYTNGAPGITNTYTQAPSTSPFTNTLDNSALDQRNTFHWGRRQYAALSTTTISSFTAYDFRKARMKHWLKSDIFVIMPTLSLQRDPSPDIGGTTEGEKTWYDHAGKTNTAYPGTQSLPLFVARVLPDGNTRFARTDRNPLGFVATNTSTYSVGGTVALRTNFFTYDVNNIDLITATNALGVQVSSNAFNAYHEVVMNFDALNQVTVFTYNTNQQLTSITSPSSLVTTNVYGADGFVAQQIQVGYATNFYTHANDLVATYTDPRGLTVTNTWDPLQRLRRIDYPDGTFITNSYDKLDLVRVMDRMGFTSSFGYDSVRHKIAETNALGNYTLYNYCTCGALDSVRDAMGNYTYFYYDNQGRLTNALYRDGFSVTYAYSLLGQRTNATDSAGTSVTNWFNNQGLRYAGSNAFGQVEFSVFDVLDRATNVVDANGVTTTNTFDNLNRLLTRGYPDGGVEKFGYTARGMFAYTNQLGFTNFYGLDALRRKTVETNANGEVTQFAYSPAGDLLTLTDGKNQATTWNYDPYGRVSNKVDNLGNTLFIYGYDPDNRLTNRTSAAKGATVYRYDATANLTNVVYPISSNIILKYDALNRLTNMVDGVGTTRYALDAAGQVLSEDGPWSDDTVSYTYANRLRTGMSLIARNASPWAQSYGWDAAKRLTNVASPAGAFGYGYDPSRKTQVSSLSLPNGAYITNAYDNVARLLSTALNNLQNSTLNSHRYWYNQSNQRTQQVFTAGNYVNYTYDPISQLLAGFGFEPGGPSRPQELFRWTYDAAGNLSTRQHQGIVNQFLVNSLNELTTETNPPANRITVVGTFVGAPALLTVNGQSATLYVDNTFTRQSTPFNYGSNTFTATAYDDYGRAATDVSVCYLPASNSYAYDLNGNLLSDGTRNFAYDDENQLTSVWVTNVWRSDFVYDGKMRRRVRREYLWQSGVWSLQSEARYIYDGMLVIQERDANNLPSVTYTRGRDLSGSLQGAGGIGGLLARTDNRLLTTGDSSASAFYHADGNGNIICLINSSNAVVAKYLYDPFGSIISQSGPLADANLYRFSGKEAHTSSGMYYYGYRFYEPGLQRWANEDPIGERGGPNLYTYVGNDPVDSYDPSGLSAGVTSIPFPRPIPIPLPGWLPPVAAGVAGGVIGWTVGTWLVDNTALGRIGEKVGDWACPKKTYSTESCTRIALSVDEKGELYCTFNCTKTGLWSAKGAQCSKTYFVRVVPD